jgi:hypothetical protein
LAHGKIEDDDSIQQDEMEVVDTGHKEFREALKALADDAMI